MKRRIIAIISVALLLIVVIISKQLWLTDENIISYKVTKIGEALATCDYTDLDKYFSSKTKFTYKGKSVSYLEAKSMLKNVLDKQEIHFGKHALYATSIITDSSTKKCKVISWILNKNNVSTEVNMMITVKMKYFFMWDVIEVNSDEDTFGYLFVDNKIKPSLIK